MEVRERVRTPEERYDANGDYPHMMQHDRKVDKLRRNEHSPANTQTHQPS